MSELSRRHFLQAAAAAGIAGLASPRARGANERIRVGIIGCRNRGHQVAQSMLSDGNYEVVALCDPDEAMAARAREALEGDLPASVPYVKDFRKLLEDPNIDAVVNATPDHWHAMATLMALDAGKHVYLEKPATYDIREARELEAASARHANLVCAMGTQQRSGAHFKDARDFIREGGLGHVGFVRCWIAHTRGPIPHVPNEEPPAGFDYDLWVGPGPFHPYNPQLCHYNWHWVRDWGTGEMGNWGAHWIDIAQWYLDLGLPTAIMGTGGTYVTQDAKQWPDTQTVLYEYPERTMVWEQRLWTDYDVNRERSGCEFGGPKGTLTISRGGWTFHPRDGRRNFESGSDLMGPHVRNFAESVRGQAVPAADMAAGALTATLCHFGNIAVEAPGRLEYDADTGTFPGDERATALVGRAYREPWEAERRALV